MAKDPSLTEYEKIGFPPSYRAGYGDVIFADILRKLPNLDRPHQIVLDIGPGCSDLPRLMIELCRRREHTLILIDAKEILDILPDEPFIVKIPARYPGECNEFCSDYAGRINVVNSYSVIQCIFCEGNIFQFLDKSLALLADGGQMLFGDVPNISRRKRFFSSETGVRFHQNFMQSSDKPEVHFNSLDSNQMDDAVVLSLLLRARLAGFHSYVVSQDPALPMANRREDILIEKP